MRLSVFFLAALATVALAFPAASIAQQSPAPASSGMYPQKGSMGGALQGIQLSDQQKQQIDTLRSQFRAAHPEGSPPDAAAIKQYQDSVMKILTPAQQTQYKANLERMRAQHEQMQQQQMMGSPAPAASPRA